MRLRRRDPASQDAARAHRASSVSPSGLISPLDVTCRYSVCRGTPGSATSVSGLPNAAWVRRSLAGVILNGRPSCRPQARVDSRPARVRSTISSCLNSARPVKKREDQPAVGGGGVYRRALNRRDQTSSVEPALCPHVGEATTDAEQRLTVLGNKGISSAVDGGVAITFANNEGWYDDISDGPVTASVILNGQALEVLPA